MTLVRMKLLVLGSAEGEFCLCFYLTRVEDETDKEFVSEVEQSAYKILGEISEREYLSYRAIGGTMPRLNRVFKEIKVMYGDHRVPEKILKSVEDKAVKASKSVVAPVAMARAEYKKRKEIDAPKAVAKKRKMAKNAEDAAEEVRRVPIMSQKPRAHFFMLVSRRLPLLAWTSTCWLHPLRQWLLFLRQEPLV